MTVSPADLVATIAVAVLGSLAIWLRVYIHVARARRRGRPSEDPTKDPPRDRDPRD